MTYIQNIKMIGKKEVRDKTILIKVSSNEKKEIKQLGERFYLGMSAFIRMLILREAYRLEKQKYN